MTMSAALPLTAFLSGTPGGFEVLILFAAILVLFGPRQLPKITRTLGKLIEELRRASQDFRDQILHADETPVPPPAHTDPSPLPEPSDPDKPDDDDPASDATHGARRPRRGYGSAAAGPETGEEDERRG